MRELIPKQVFGKASFERTMQTGTAEKVHRLQENSWTGFPLAIEFHPVCRFLALDLRSTGTYFALCYDSRPARADGTKREKEERERERLRGCAKPK